MKKLFLCTLCALLSIGFAMAESPDKGVSQYVNPFIGTSNFGVTHPGPVVPGGMVSMSPFNTIPREEHYINTDGWCSTPFVYENIWCIGFTQVNLSGVGCPDFGSLLLMPQSGELEVDFQKYAAKLYDQSAEAGYYSARVGESRILSEMTATRRTTLSRYTLPVGQNHILFNVGVGLTTESGGYVKQVNEREVEGMKLLGDFCYGQPQAVVPIYFVVRASEVPTSTKYFKKQPALPAAVASWSAYSDEYKIYDRYNRELAGDNVGFAFNFLCDSEKTIEVSVGISYVSIENARENLNTEQPSGVSFETIRDRAVAEWNEVLDVVEVEGGTYDQKVQFYTSLYHNWIHPNTLSDVNGEYPAMGSGETLNVKDYNERERLTMFSGWDVYRITPFLGALFYPERQSLMARSMMQMYRENGALPKFEICGQDFMVMEGDAALPYLSSCYLLGLTKGIDPEELYTAMRKNAMNETYVRGDQTFYNENHYIPWLSQYDNSVSQALEYYVADWSISQIAKALGKEADHKVFLERAMGYKKYFDKDYALLRPLKEDGEFMEGFNPLEGENFEPSNGFHEGTSWNYSFSIPYDIEGLIKLFGSKKRFVDSLEVSFTKGYFDMGNEPDMNYPYYFSFIKGEEWRTQKWVKYCLDSFYSNTPGGLPGNDDAGTMSAWQMFSQMGLYPVCPARAEYIITTPVFDKTTINLSDEFYGGGSITIEAKNLSPENIYIEKILLDGKPYKSYFISHEQLLKTKNITIYCTDKK
ncbi:MAG: GH92 family glycosyl hydrolase [Rikenellaceae bacterium]